MVLLIQPESRLWCIYDKASNTLFYLSEQSCLALRLGDDYPVVTQLIITWDFCLILYSPILMTKSTRHWSGRDGPSFCVSVSFCILKDTCSKTSVLWFFLKFSWPSFLVPYLSALKVCCSFLKSTNYMSTYSSSDPFLSFILQLNCVERIVYVPGLWFLFLLSFLNVLCISFCPQSCANTSQVH